MTTATERAKNHSEAKLDALRERIAGVVPPNDIVVTCGSYARREASAESDIDFFAITHPAAMLEQQADGGSLPWISSLKSAVSEIVPIEPAEDGAFSMEESSDAMLHNIGGNQDSNQKITRRMLFLLEGEWLFNADGFRRIRRQVLERYIGEGISRVSY